MRVPGRPALTLALAAALLVPAHVAGAAGPDPAPPGMLTAPKNGEAAITALGDQIDEAAAVNDLSVRELKHDLRDDPTLWVGRQGRLHYQEAAASAATSEPEVQVATAALADTFTLHSREGSKHVIYLDFGGATITSSSWWVTEGVMSPRTATGYSQDGDPAFNDTEKTYIQQVWAIVAEKFAAFDVDVTTENPGAAAYNRTSEDDLTWGDRVVFSSDDAATADACGCPGVAFIGTFDEIDNGEAEPTWVFTDPLGNSAALAANAAAHEIGHTFGLDHDGKLLSEYYSGHAMWVPLMGTTTSKPVAQFSKGEYSGATNTEDDLALIATGGAPLIADLVGDTRATATPVATLPYSGTGLISTAGDQDVYAVTTSCIGDLTATAAGVGVGQTLDIQLTVYDANGVLLGAADPAVYASDSLAYNMNASYTVTDAAAATYYVEIDGVGSGGLGATPNPSSGYSDYASTGQYTLSIAECTDGINPPTAPRNLTASPVQRSTNGSVSWTAPVSAGSGALTGYTVTGLPGSPVTLGPTTTSAASTSLVPGTTYPVQVVASNGFGNSPAASVNLRISTWLPTTAPVVSSQVAGNDAGLTWGTVANPGKATLTGWSTTLKRDGVTVATRNVLIGSPRSASFPDLRAGRYTFSVRITGSADLTAGTTAGTAAFTVAAPPSAPAIGTPSSGTAGGTVTAVARWGAPTSTGGSPITGYRVVAYKLTAAGNIAKAYYSPLRSSASRAYTWTTLPAARYKFKVVAYNAVGSSPRSAYSAIVTAR